MVEALTSVVELVRTFAFKSPSNAALFISVPLTQAVPLYFNTCPELTLDIVTSFKLVNDAAA